MKKKHSVSKDSQILSEKFWDAFLNGVYPEFVEGIVAFNLESYADLLEGIGYTKTLYGKDFHKDWDFFINIACLKGIALISLHSISQPDRLIGNIEVNPRRKFKKEKRLFLSYFKEKVKKKPNALIILRKLGREFFDNAKISLKEIERNNGTLQFVQLLKIITSCAIWKRMINENCELSLKEKAEYIGDLLNIDPVSVSIYGRYSLDTKVIHEANKVSRPLLNEKSNITELWQNLAKKNPNLLPEEKATILGSETGLQPSTVANYAKASIDKIIRNEGRIASKKIEIIKFDLTNKWKKLLDKYPQWTPKKRAEEIAKNISIGPITATTYLKESANKVVKKNSILAYYMLVDDKHGITNKWSLLMKSHPNFSPLEHVKIIADELELSTGYISLVGTYSTDQQVSKESNVAAKLNGVEKHNITERWMTLIIDRPKIGYTKRAILIGKAVNIDEITVAGYATYSSNPLVKKEANLALKTIAENKKGITNLWLEILKKYPKLTSKEIVQKIALKLNIEPTTTATYGKASSNKMIKNQCNKVFSELSSIKKDIKGNWNKIKKTNPKLNLEENIELLLKILKISEGTLYMYSRSIEDDELRKGIEKSYYRYVDKKHNITNRWLKILEGDKLPNYMKTVKLIADEAGLSVITVSNITRHSSNAKIKTLGSTLTGKLLNEKHNLTELWSKIMVEKSFNEPSEIAEYLSEKLNLKPSTIASYAMYSELSEVKDSANITYNQVRERRYNIIKNWKRLNKTPQEKARILGNETGLREITVCSYARYAADPKVKKEAIKLYTQLLKEV